MAMAMSIGIQIIVSLNEMIVNFSFSLSTTFASSAAFAAALSDMYVHSCELQF